MICPQCAFEKMPDGGVCPRCRYSQRAKTITSSYYLNRNIQEQSPVLPRPNLIHTLMRGDVLHKGRYRLVEQITLPENKLGQGVAWTANDMQTQHKVDIYPLPADLNQQQREDLITTATMLGKHRGLQRFIETFTERGIQYLVLEHIEGETLSARLQRQNGALPERVVVEYGIQLCDILSHFLKYSPPIVHGAINPTTIIVSPDGSQVSLIHVLPYKPREKRTSKEHVSSRYIAPEQAQAVIHPSIDLYSVAATLHHAVTGFDPQERLAFFHPPARRLNPTVTQGIETILAKELRLSAAQRYARPEEMRQELANLLPTYPQENEQVRAKANRLAMSPAELREISRSRSLRSIGLVGTICLIALLVMSFIIILPLVGPALSQGSSSEQATATATALLASEKAEIALETQYYHKQNIGISDGRFVFDTYAGRTDVDLKKQASQAMQNGDLSSAVNLLSQAITIDPTDGEAQIYNEDVHIQQQGTPYVTIVLGMDLASDSIYIVRGRTELQGAFLAQHEINTRHLLPQGLQLRLLIDSSGGNGANVGTAAQFIANRVAKAGNLDHIIGVVGWPFSSSTLNAHDIIAGVHLPMVSQTASSVKLSGSTYFFRVNPPDDAQGNALAKAAVQQLHAHTILVMRDPTNPYSVSLADAFASQVSQLGAQAINNRNDYFTVGVTTVANYENIVNDAVADKADLIFMPSFDADAVRLAHALGNIARNNPGNRLLAKMHIMGGDGLDTGLLLGQGSGADAQIAANYPGDMQRLIFSAFAHADEWKKVPHSQQPAFFTDWTTIYQSSSVQGNNAPPPGNDAILTNDAVQVIARATNYVRGPLTGQAVHDALAALGNGNIPDFQGISGRIHFDAQGNPVDKAVVVLDVEDDGNGNVIKLMQVVGAFR